MTVINRIIFILLVVFFKSTTHASPSATAARTFGRPQINRYENPSLMPVDSNNNVESFNIFSVFDQKILPPKGKYPKPSANYPASFNKMPKHGTMPTVQFRSTMKSKGFYKDNVAVGLGYPYIGYRATLDGVNAVGSQYFAGMKQLPENSQRY